MQPRANEYAKRGIAYAQGVVSGDIPACEMVRLACQRHLDDIERAKDGAWEWKWNPAKGERICRLAEQLPHIKGRWKTATLKLEDWQCFILTCIFGWVDDEEMRRFRKALIVIPRKTGKSTLAAIVGLYLLAFDGEPGAEVYSAATSRDQANISWGVAQKMVQRTPALMEETGIQPLAHSIVLEADGSCFRALSSDAHTLEGLNVHGGIIDELHAHKSREVFDVIDDGTGSRRQPLLFVISTEGDSNEGVFPEQVTYLENVLRGVHKDETFFGAYYSLDKGDDWTLESSWRKAIPNYGISVFEHDMRARCTQAKQNPGSQASFLTKRLNVRVGNSAGYFNMLAWNGLCKVEGLEPEDLRGHPCVFSIDMASKSDLTTIVKLFTAIRTEGRLKAGHQYVFTRSYIPEAALEDGKPNRELYLGWVAANQIQVTPGNITDYEFLKRDLVQDVRTYRPSRVGIDPNYNALQFTTEMQAEGVPMEDVAHSVMNFTNPMKIMAAQILSGRIHHNGDPVLTWSIGNVAGKIDAKDNHYPEKTRRENKIDPAVTLIAAGSLVLRLADNSGASYQVIAI